MMRSVERRDELMRLVRDRGYVNVTDAATEIGVDTSTIRRDLARLDGLGLVERSHGGAIPVRDEAEVPYHVKIGKRVAEKEAIGAYVAGSIGDGASLMLDSGSTSLMVARALSEHHDITVITPDIRVAGELSARSDVRLIVPGGEVLASTYTLLSQEAVESLRRYHVDVAVICADAVDPDGVTNMNGAVVPIKRAMIENSRRSVLAVDSSKMGLRKLVRVAEVQELTDIVTDDGLEAAAPAAYPVSLHRAAVPRGAALNL